MRTSLNYRGWGVLSGVCASLLVSACGDDGTRGSDSGLSGATTSSASATTEPVTTGPMTTGPMTTGPGSTSEPVTTGPGSSSGPPPSCGDGNVDDGEECDDGNAVDTDDCSNACVLAACDDAVKNGKETDVDCGGGDCGACGFGDECAVDDDCDTLFCENGACAWPQSCAAILAKNPNANSGQYMIDVDGGGPGLAFFVQCDMETDGGGWTLIANLHSNRIPQSVYRGKRFFTAAWKQLLNGNETSTNDQVALGGDVYGMLDAQGLIGISSDLRYHCHDESRMLEADAIWTPSAADWTELLGSLIYSAQSKATKIAKNGAAYAAVQTYPTAANLQTYGCWHICGNCGPAQQQLSFQLGLCHNSPAQGDTNLADINQVAIGYHDGYQQLRLECTADTPPNTPVLNGTWQAWVR